MPNHWPIRMFWTPIGERFGCCERGVLASAKLAGIALNLHGAGPPTKDVELIVRRADWLRALPVLRRIGTDRQGIRFGLPGEPSTGLAVVEPHGVPIELWPAGTRHEEIARIRGMSKPRGHPAGKLNFTLQGNATVAFINAKLASYLSARDRLRDAADVQILIRHLKLPRSSPVGSLRQSGRPIVVCGFNDSAPGSGSASPSGWDG